MLCVRCAQPLAFHADRCLRCFALNPQNWTEPIAPAPRLAAALPADLALSIDSDPPQEGLDVGALCVHSAPPQEGLELGALSVRSDPPPEGGIDPHLAVTEPPDQPLFSDPAPPPRLESPAPLPRLESPAPLPVHVPETSLLLDTTPLPPLASLAPVASAPPEHPDRPSARRQLSAWSFDALVLSTCLGLFVWLAVWTLGKGHLAPTGSQSAQSWADLLLAGRALKLAWVVLVLALALAYSWLSAALGGRTPGMALAGLRLEREDGSTVSPTRALVRALLSLFSGAIGLFGFWLALLDPRGQTLHDKLTQSVIVRAR